MKKYLAIFFLILLAACKKEVVETEYYFSEPQPVNDSELKDFPSKFIHSYVDASGDTLVIESNTIYYRYYNINSVSKDSLLGKEGEFLSSSTKIESSPGLEAKKIKEDKDSVYIGYLHRDTLFRFSDLQKAKRMNGHLVLSTSDSIFWKIRLLTIKGDSLYIRYFSEKADYAKLQAVVKDIKNNNDTTVVELKPTRREFKKLLKLGLNGNMKFRRIK
jgi:hypothetical protein